MIEDEELRQQYRSESTEHLQCIEQGLITLEGDPSRKDVLEALLRDLHSLKGDARMLGLSAIEDLAHSGEERLRPAWHGERQLDINDLKQLYSWLDALRALTEEASGGRPANVDVTAEKARIQSGISGEPVRLHEPAVPREPESRVEDYRIETIRVPTARLDSLLVDAGELAVTRSRLFRRLQELEGTTTAVEEWGALHRRRIKDDPAAELAKVQNELGRLYALLSEDLSRLGAVTDQIAGDAHNLRLLPFSFLFQLFIRNVRDLAEAEGKKIELVTEGGETLADKRIIEELKDPLIHLVGNAVHHSIETSAARQRAGKPPRARITLRAERRGRGLLVEVADDGAGLDPDRLKKEALDRGLISKESAASLKPDQLRALVFLPGLSTDHYITNLAGRGIGMDVVREKVERLKGRVEIESQTGRGAKFRLHLPMTVISTHVLLVRLGRNLFAIPTEFVEISLPVESAMISTAGGRPTLIWRGAVVKLVSLDPVLELAGQESELSAAHYCVILHSGDDYLGLLVDAVVDEQEVIVKPTGALLKRVRNVAGTSILGSGDICMVLNAHDLFASAGKVVSETRPMHVEREGKRSRILLVEDSLITRTQESRILDSAGYDVVIAVDGVDALRRLDETEVNAVVADVLMPNMDGLALTRRLRENPKTAELPVILVTTLASEDDRRRGMEVGADAYIVKSLFEQEALLSTLRRFID